MEKARPNEKNNTEKNTKRKYSPLMTVKLEETEWKKESKCKRLKNQLEC